jgi:hypothetical protein
MKKPARTITDLLVYEKGALSRFRRALRRKDQLVFDELWEYVQRHLWAANLADSLLPVEFFLLTMLMEEHKEIRKLRVKVGS